MSSDEASATLARLLPSFVDELSPEGELPECQPLEGMIGGLMGARPRTLGLRSLR